ncbi:hypothetical protein [Uliginosibacterium sediminicola]|uniref:Uncharacterized protein n=1 Tax=Uliginosibacterium sediminicola TaxID=2024550 RepID=A0ABU9YVJ3_9RHOO
MSAAQKPRNSLLRVWAMPVLLAALTLFGLLAALLGSGAWHVLSWVSLCLPLLIVLRYLL